MDERHCLEDLRSTQQRQLATIRTALPNRMAKLWPESLSLPAGDKPTELQARLVAEEFLTPEIVKRLADLELVHARYAVHLTLVGIRPKDNWSADYFGVMAENVDGRDSGLLTTADTSEPHVHELLKVGLLLLIADELTP